MQDARLGLFNPEEREDEQTYLVATENCEIHEFRGDNWVEAGCRRIRKRTCGCIGRVARDTERERLPFAFVTLNTKLLMIMAARRLWAPNTITGVYGWVPVHPLSADGVYRREEYDKRESLPRKNVPSWRFVSWTRSGPRGVRVLQRRCPWFGGPISFDPGCLVMIGLGLMLNRSRPLLGEWDRGAQGAKTVLGNRLPCKGKFLSVTIVSQAQMRRRSLSIIWKTSTLRGQKTFRQPLACQRSVWINTFTRLQRWESSWKFWTHRRRGNTMVRRNGRKCWRNTMRQKRNSRTSISTKASLVQGRCVRDFQTWWERIALWMTHLRWVEVSSGTALTTFLLDFPPIPRRLSKESMSWVTHLTWERWCVSTCAVEKQRSTTHMLWTKQELVRLGKLRRMKGKWCLNMVTSLDLTTRKPGHGTGPGSLCQRTATCLAYTLHAPQWATLWKRWKTDTSSWMLRSARWLNWEGSMYKELQESWRPIWCRLLSNPENWRECSKVKPRAIISAGDAGVIRHVFDAGILESVLFENPVFEDRSIKHASQSEVSRRAGELMRAYDYVASMDFGAFDGPCTSEIRTLVENDIIVSLFSKLLGTENDKGLLYQAVFDRIKHKANISVKTALRAVIEDMIRESGGRGTSILNFITNLVLFLPNISMMLSKHGLREAEARKMMWDVLTKGRHANIMAEGDDGIHAFVKELVEMFGGVCEFGKLWCSCYAEYGFQIEPQGNQGEVIPEDCLAPTTQRMEFCSKIFVAVENIHTVSRNRRRFRTLWAPRSTWMCRGTMLVLLRLWHWWRHAWTNRFSLSCAHACTKSTGKREAEQLGTFWQRHSAHETPSQSTCSSVSMAKMVISADTAFTRSCSPSIGILFATAMQHWPWCKHSNQRQALMSRPRKIWWWTWGGTRLRHCSGL